VKKLKSLNDEKLREFVIAQIVQAMKNMNDDDIKKLTNMALYLCSKDTALCNKMIFIMKVLELAMKSYLKSLEQNK